MFRCVQITAARRAVIGLVAPFSSNVTSRRLAASTAAPTESVADADLDYFDRDLWFLDELMDEGSADMFSYIPEADAPILQHEQK